MSDINIIAVIAKLRPRVTRSRRVTLDDLADEIAKQSGFDRGDARDFAYKFAQSMVNPLRVCFRLYDKYSKKDKFPKIKQGVQ